METSYVMCRKRGKKRIHKSMIFEMLTGGDSEEGRQVGLRIEWNGGPNA
jgi:hypothetical protein